MSSYLQWIILSSLTHSPILSAVLVLLGTLTFERVAFGVLPSPFRFLARFRREFQLKKQVRHNVHDGRARLELAALLNQRRAFGEALLTLRPNLDKGDGDVSTLFTFATSCLGAGHFEQGQKLMLHAQEIEPQFRVGEIDLSLGKARLVRKEPRLAQVHFEAFLQLRKGSVEGRVLLAQALHSAGDDAQAALMRDTAWHEYETAPSFQQRQERWWAWKARPSRPLLYAALALVAVVALFKVVRPSLETWAAQQSQTSPEDEP
jgi:hypothetical protein